jgi:hypothetical protein
VSWLAEWWQWIAVAIIQVTAVAYLARKFFGGPTKQVRRGPDVPVSALVRKKKG